MVKWEIGYPTSSIKGNGLAGKAKSRQEGRINMMKYVLVVTVVDVSQNIYLHPIFHKAERPL